MKTPMAWTAAGATGTTPAVRKVSDSIRRPCGPFARCRATSSAGDPGPGRYRWVSSLTLEGSRSATEQPDVRHQGRDHVRGVRDEEPLDERRALVELDKSRSQVERLAMRPVHGLVDLVGVPEGGPDVTGHHDHGLVDRVIIGLADRQSMGAAVDRGAFDLEALNAHRGQFRELPVDDGDESLGLIEVAADRGRERGQFRGPDAEKVMDVPIP
jgi:hypothetical protein